MRIAVAIIVCLMGLTGCTRIHNSKGADAYAAAIASNQTEYQNGLIPLSEKLRRDYLVGVQYGQINKIEASCTELYLKLAKAYERGTIREGEFNDRRDSLEMACNKAYATGDYSPVDAWRTGYAIANAYRR